VPSTCDFRLVVGSFIMFSGCEDDGGFERLKRVVFALQLYNWKGSPVEKKFALFYFPKRKCLKLKFGEHYGD